jgi:tetratricopeptide (TPR) repeat protein
MMQHRKKADAALRKHDYAAAEKAFLAALEEAESGHQPNAYKVLQLKTLGVFYFSRGRLEEAEDCLQRALASERQLLGPESLEICSGLNLIGLLYHVRRRFDRAEEAYKEALEIQERAAFSRIPEANSKTYHMSLHHLAMVYCTQGKVEQALGICRQASERIGKITGPGGRNLAIDFQNVSVNCCAEGRQTEALETCQWMLDLCFKELQREFLGNVVDQGGLGQLGAKPSHLPADVDSLAYLYHEAWRPAEIYRQAPGQVQPQEKSREDAPGQPMSPDREDYWRPEKR